MAAFADFQLPEMQRSPLEELCLQVRMLAEASSLGGERGGGAAAVGTGAGSTAAFLLQAVEPPVPQAISNAVGLLQDIGALKEDESLTRLGRHLGEMPVHPRVGKMLLYATLLGVLDPVLTVACAAAYRRDRGCFLVSKASISARIADRSTEKCKGKKGNCVTMQ